MHELERCAVAAGDRGTVLEGYVAAFDGGVMTVASDGGHAAGLEAGEDVQVLVLDEVRGEVLYSGWVAEVGPTSIELADLELVSTLQKRQVARVRITQICTGVVEATEDLAPRSITFVVHDISAHGMRIATAGALEDKDRIAFDFPTGEAVVALDAEVLRAQRTSTGSTQYGCRFVDIADKDADVLFRYVLRTQGAERRRRLQS
jgi:hypothetical protein